MNTPWTCAVCESSNDGGDTCAVCGATVVQTTTRATPVPEPPARATAEEEPATEVPVRELPVRQPAGEPPAPDGYDRYDYFMVGDGADVDDSYARSEEFDVRPRVRVYGCCLPISLGLLLVVAGAAAGLVNLLLGAL